MYIEISHIPPSIEALIAALAILGGLMAFWSGLLVTISFLARQPSAGQDKAVNRGFAAGFVSGMFLAVRVAMIVIGNAQ